MCKLYYFYKQRAMAAEAEASREARAKVNKSKFLNETCQQIVESQ